MKDNVVRVSIWGNAVGELWTRKIWGVLRENF